MKVAFIGKCGNDVFGQFMLTEMSKRNIDITNVIVDETSSTGLSVILNRDSDRAILTYLGIIPSLKAEDITDGLLQQARYLHVASYFMQKALQPGLPQLFNRAHTFGLTTSLDTNYDPSEKWVGLDQLLKETNVFFPNETEACSITGTKNVDQAADQLSKKVYTLAVKPGSQGAMGVDKVQKVKIPSIKIKLLDSIGAGDSFDAGFLYGYLQGWTLEKNLKAANICGALSTQASGGTTSQPTLDEVLREYS
jgi:sugar/nucleoside kinase (ribokinase family)